jgi:hypothetical protein
MSDGISAKIWARRWLICARSATSTGIMAGGAGTVALPGRYPENELWDAVEGYLDLLDASRSGDPDA